MVEMRSPKKCYFSIYFSKCDISLNFVKKGYINHSINLIISNHKQKNEKNRGK